MLRRRAGEYVRLDKTLKICEDMLPNSVFAQSKQDPTIPVGGITLTEGENPAAVLGYGTWQQIGRFSVQEI